MSTASVSTGSGPAADGGRARPARRGGRGGPAAVSFVQFGLYGGADGRPFREERWASSSGPTTSCRPRRTRRSTRPRSRTRCSTSPTRRCSSRSPRCGEPSSTSRRSKKRLELQEEQFFATIDHLQDQAKQALQANREDLAKEALARKAAAQQQIDEMEPQRKQLEEEEQKLTTTLDALQKRVNDFRTQKETLKAQYTTAKAISTVDESAAGISKSFNDSGASLQRAQDKIATMQARSGALDELLESGVLEDVGGGTDDIQKELDQVGTDAQVDNELAALKAQLGTGAPPEPDALAPAARGRGRRTHFSAGRLDELGHDVGQLGAAVLLEEVARTGDAHVPSPGRPGIHSANTSAHPAVPGSSSENTVSSGRPEARNDSTLPPVDAGALAVWRRPHQRREPAGPRRVGVVGKRGIVGGQDRRGHVRDRRPLHEQAGTEGRQVLGEALVVEQHLSRR